MDGWLSYDEWFGQKPTHLELLSPGVLRVTDWSVDPVVGFDTALSCVLRHRECLPHQSQPTDWLHNQLLQVVVWDLLGRKEKINGQVVRMGKEEVNFLTHFLLGVLHVSVHGRMGEGRQIDALACVVCNVCIYGIVLPAWCMVHVCAYSICMYL